MGKNLFQFFFWFLVFIFYRNPNINEQPDVEWPAYRKEDRRHLCFDVPCSVGSDIGLDRVHLYSKILSKL